MPTVLKSAVLGRLGEYSIALCTVGKVQLNLVLRFRREEIERSIGIWRNLKIARARLKVWTKQGILCILVSGEILQNPPRRTINLSIVFLLN